MSEKSLKVRLVSTFPEAAAKKVELFFELPEYMRKASQERDARRFCGFTHAMSFRDKVLREPSPCLQALRAQTASLAIHWALKDAKRFDLVSVESLLREVQGFCSIKLANSDLGLAAEALAQLRRGVEVAEEDLVRARNAVARVYNALGSLIESTGEEWGRDRDTGEFYLTGPSHPKLLSILAKCRPDSNNARLIAAFLESDMELDLGQVAMLVQADPNDRKKIDAAVQYLKKKLEITGYYPTFNERVLRLMGDDRAS